VRASSALISALFEPDAEPDAPLPGRSADATVSLPAFGGTSARCSLGAFVLDEPLVLLVVFAGVFAGSGAVPVSATSVGFDAAPPRQSSICECTVAAASLAEPTALI